MINLYTSEAGSALDPEEDRAARLRELLAKYRAQRDEAEAAANSVKPVGQEELEAALDDRSRRNFSSAMLRAANKIGNLGGEAVTSDFGEYANEQNAIDAEQLKAKQGLYDRLTAKLQNAQGAYAEADSAMYSHQRQSAEDKKKNEEYNRQQAIIADEANPQSAVSEQYRLLAKKLMPNGKFDNLSASQLKQGLPVLEKVYSVDQNNQARRDAAAAAALARKDAAEAKQDEKNKKKEVQDAMLVVPGYEHNPAVGVKAEDAEKLRVLVASKNNLDAMIDEYNQAIDDYGTGEFMDSEGAGKLDSISRQIHMELKNLQGLGVLSGPDLALLEQQVPAPGVWQRKTTMLTKNNTLKEGMATRVKAAAAARGYKEKDTSPHGMRVVQNGVTYKWNGSQYVEEGK